MTDDGSADFWARTAGYARALTSAPELSSVHEQHLRRAGELIAADRHDIIALDPARLAPVAVTTQRPDDDWWERYEAAGGRAHDPLFQYALAKRRPVHDRVIFPVGDWPTYLPRFASVLRNPGLRHFMLVPLIRHGALIGTLHFSRDGSRPPFSEHDLRVATTIMGLAANATHNALAYERMREEGEAVRAVLRSSPDAMLVCDLQTRVVCASGRAARLEAGATPAARRELLALLRDSIREAASTGRPVRRVWGRLELETGRIADARGMFVTRMRSAAPAGVDVAALVPPLSRREADVLECVIGGLHNHETAEVLGISVNTVKRHLKQVYRKLGVRGRTEAVRHAMTAAARE